jgi:hypothetical protein
MTGAATMKFPIKSIKPNPFRDPENFPIQADKIEALRESIRATGYWCNILARLVDGVAEIAYGHHRIEALREEFGEDHEVELIIRDISDQHMLQMLSRENREEWKTSASFEIKVVRRTVEAYANGAVHLEAPDDRTPKSDLRFAPSFVLGPDTDVTRAARGRPYTAVTLGRFLGFIKPSGDVQDRVRDALTILQFAEDGLISETAFAGLSRKQAGALISEARQAHDFAKRRAKGAAGEAAFHTDRAAQAQQKLASAKREWAEKRAKAAETTNGREQYEANRDAEEARRQAQQAALTIKNAGKRAYDAKAKEQLQLEKARKDPATLANEIGSKLRSGELGYRQVPEAAASITRTKPQRRREDVAVFARKLLTRISQILDSGDLRATELKQLIVLLNTKPTYTQATIAKLMVDGLREVEDRVHGYVEHFLRFNAPDPNDAVPINESPADALSQEQLAPPRAALTDGRHDATE